MQIVLFEPEIPPNTGNIARLCAATGVVLNLIEPLGFKLENRYLKRAGLDYWPFVQMRVWSDWSAFVTRADQSAQERLVLTSAKQREISVPLPQFVFQPDDCLVFGPETRGLPQNILACSAYHLYIPMLAGTTRSLNLATATGIVLYTALMQCHLTEMWIR